MHESMDGRIVPAWGEGSPQVGLLRAHTTREPSMNTCRPRPSIFLPAAAAVLLSIVTFSASAGDKPPSPEQIVEETNSFYAQQQTLNTGSQDHRDAQIDRQSLEQNQATARRLVTSGLPRNQLDIAPRQQIVLACEEECRKMGYEAAQCTQWCKQPN